jgi:hypothetical protein
MVTPGPNTVSSRWLAMIGLGGVIGALCAGIGITGGFSGMMGDFSGMIGGLSARFSVVSSGVG